MNNIINENKKNIELIRKDISIIYDKLSKQLNDLKINNKNNQEIKYNNNNNRNRYIGQVLNGVPEGKGIMYWNEGDRYEGEWKNDQKEGIIIVTMNLRVIDMKVIIKMVKKKEKEFIIIIMVIGKWVIFIMVNQQENL